MATTCRCGGASGPVQEFCALAQGGERRLQVMGQVAEETVLLGLEFRQAQAQPVETFSQALQIRGAADVDRPCKICTAQLPDRGIQLRDGSRDEARQRERGCERQRRRHEDHHDQAAMDVVRARAEPLDFAVGDKVALGQHLVGAVHHGIRQRPQGTHVGRRTRPRLQHAIDKRLLALHGDLQGGQLAGVKLLQLQLARDLQEARVRAGEILPQLAVGQHSRLQREALDGRDAIHQRSARGRSHGRAGDSAAPLLGEPLRVPGGVQQRAQQRQGDQQEACNKQAEERPWEAQRRGIPLCVHANIMAR
jgi:hypothetical protein